MTKGHKYFDRIFRKHTKTYYSSALLFPPTIRQDVAILYAFVRTADELVDNPIKNPEKALKEFRRLFYAELAGAGVDEPVIKEFVAMMKRRQIPPSWVDSFLDSMAMDLSVVQYPTFTELKKYTYGSAEVIGLMMAKVTGVPKQGYPAAKALGLSMQLINFLRDINEDLNRGRIYWPLADLKRFKIEVEEWNSRINPLKFGDLIQFEVMRIEKIQDQAEQGFKYIPPDCRRAVELASKLYVDTLTKIKAEPMAVWSRKVKPNYFEISQLAAQVYLSVKT